MSRDDLLGKVGQRHDSTEVDWKIPNFSELLADTSVVFHKSPGFAFLDAWWHLKMMPNFCCEHNFALLIERTEGQKCSALFKMFLRNAKGDRVAGNFRTDSKWTLEGRGFSIFINNLDLLQRKSEFLPSDVLTVVCQLRRSKPRPVAISWTERLLNLSRDLKAILLEGLHSDVVLKLGEKEIKEHKVVLQKRCDVFKAMFSRDMAESQTGLVKIDVIEPDTFEQVLSYLNCGEVKDLSTENVFRLFEAAHMYQVKELKELCLQYMEQNISDDAFCDVFTIADTYEEQKLMELVKKYFNQNSVSILEAEEWTKFEAENHNAANKILKFMIKENAHKLKK